MENRIEFVLKPVSGAAAESGGFRAILKTAKGDAMDFDAVIAEALDRGYIGGVKDVLAKAIVKGTLDSMIAGVLRDGVTRRIGDYLSVSMKVHGLFKDEHEEFDPERHSLALSLKQLNAFRPSFKGVKATNVNHKRQFRIYSAHSVHAKGSSGQLTFGDEILVNGADFLAESRYFGVMLHIIDSHHSMVSFDLPVLSVTDRTIKCGWPADFSAPIGDGCGELEVSRMEKKGDAEETCVWRSIKIKVVPAAR